MTCIVGLVHKGKVYMGADSAGSDDRTTRSIRVPKLFRINVSLKHREHCFLIAYTHSFRFGQIVNFHLKPFLAAAADLNYSPGEYMVTVFVAALREALKAHGFMGKDDEGFDFGGTMMVGYCGHLYSIYTDFQVNEFADDMDALGSGHMFALGAMAATPRLSPEKRIRTALEAAGRFDRTVCGPYHVEVL